MANSEIIWHFTAVNAKGETKRFRCSKYVDLAAWGDTADEAAREAAIWATIQETLPGLAAESEKQGGPVWHLTKPASIEIFDVRSLSDVGL